MPNLISLFRLKLICWLPLLLISVCVSFSKDKRLSEYGYSDDRNGALSLLRLLNQKQDPKLLSEYLSELDSNDFSNRERATRNLSRLPVIDRLFLKESLKSSTPEVGFRIRSILKQNNKERFDGMIRAMSYEIIRGKHAGLLSDLFSSVEDREQYSMSGMWRSFAEASEVTANEEDVELLKRKLISENDMIRYSSVKTLLSILGEESLPLIATNITDQNPHIKWECANAF